MVTVPLMTGLQGPGSSKAQLTHREYQQWLSVITDTDMQCLPYKYDGKGGVAGLTIRITI